MENLIEILGDAVGSGKESHELSAAQMAVRAVFVYGAGLLIVRIGSRRFMGRTSAFDLIVAIMLGSILARAVTGNSPLLPALAAGAALVAAHWILAALAVRFDFVSRFVKGREVELVRDGQIHWDRMRHYKVGERDLMEALRLKGNTADLSKVKFATLERNGDISVVKKEEE